jgi:rhodanese-related sulfurtransferase
MKPTDPELTQIKQRAAERGRQKQLAYAGAVTPPEAHLLMEAGVATLIDVRTEAEQHYVGSVPGTDGVEWNRYPDGQRNPDFLAELEKSVPKDRPVMFLCRSGVRSHGAAEAATKAGWKEAYNILEGFEGDKDADGHRGRIGGWRKAGLPWIQS